MSPITPNSPILVVSYGDEGVVWLDAFESWMRRSQPLLGRYLGSLIQLWAVVDDAEEYEAASDAAPFLLGSGTPETVLRERLDLGRTAELLREFPSLSVKSVLVLERWSPYHSGLLRRHRFHQSMDVMRRVDFDPEQGREIHFNWVGVADCVRSPGPLDPALTQEVREHFAPPLLTNFNFLVDRADQAGAVVTEQGAAERTNAVTSTLAVAALSGSDLASDLVTLDSDERDDTSDVRPVSATVFNHGEQELAAIAVHRLTRRILLRRLPEGALAADETLPDQVKASLSPGSVGGEPNQAVVAAALARGMMRGTVRMERPWRELEEAAAIADAASRFPGGHGTAASLDLMADRPGCLPKPLARLAGSIRQGFLPPPKAELPGPESHSDASAAPTAWCNMIGTALHVARAFDLWLALSEPVRGEASDVWQWREGAYWLAAEPGGYAHDQLGPLSRPGWESVAREALALALQDTSAAESGEGLVEEAIERTAWTVETTGDESSEHLVESAFRRWQRSGRVRWPALSVYTGSELPRLDWVAWIHGLSGLQAGFFEDLEASGTQCRPIRVRLGDQTIRLGVGQSIPWQKVLSLGAAWDAQ